VEILVRGHLPRYSSKSMQAFNKNILSGILEAYPFQGSFHRLDKSNSYSSCYQLSQKQVLNRPVLISVRVVPSRRTGEGVQHMAALRKRNEALAGGCSCPF